MLSQHSIWMAIPVPGLHCNFADLLFIENAFWILCFFSFLLCSLHVSAWRIIWAIEWRLKRHVHIQSDEITRIIFVTCESTLPHIEPRQTYGYGRENTFAQCDFLLLRALPCPIRLKLNAKRQKIPLACMSTVLTLKLNTQKKIIIINYLWIRNNKMLEKRKIVVRTTATGSRLKCSRKYAANRKIRRKKKTKTKTKNNI